MKSAPMMKAWARPSGLGCAAYVSSMPHLDPSPSRRWNWAWSSGVVMISTSRMPAIISVDSG